MTFLIQIILRIILFKKSAPRRTKKQGKEEANVTSWEKERDEQRGDFSVLLHDVHPDQVVHRGSGGQLCLERLLLDVKLHGFLGGSQRRWSLYEQ